jgi:hypothetical protein
MNTVAMGPWLAVRAHLTRSVTISSRHAGEQRIVVARSPETNIYGTIKSSDFLQVSLPT